MFLLRTKEGHAYVKAETEAQRDRYINSGFMLVSSDGKSVEETATALDDVDVPKDIETTLAEMTVAELKAYATDMGIELKSTKKADIIKEIIGAGETEIN